MRWLALTAAPLLAAMMAGCASPQPKTKDADLTKIDQWLPGHYDNRTQIEEERTAGRAPDPELSLIIVPIESLMLGNHAFYLEQTRAESAGHSPAQRIVVFSIVGKELVEAQFTLAEPARWRDGAQNPELFTSLQQPDLKPLRGCGLVWKRTGARYTGEGDAARCRASAPSGAGAVLGAMRAEITAEEVAFGARKVATASSPPAAPLPAVASQPALQPASRPAPQPAPQPAAAPQPAPTDGVDSFIRFRRTVEN